MVWHMFFLVHLKNILLKDYAKTFLDLVYVGHYTGTPLQLHRYIAIRYKEENYIVQVIRMNFFTNRSSNLQQNLGITDYR